MSNEKKPTVSIVVPVYNTPEKFLDECFKSIMEQTFTDYEVIVVDDCTKYPQYIVDKCKKLGFKYVRHDKNLGIAHARNTGIKEANGEFLYFISSDDAMLTYTLQIFVEATIRDNSPDCIYYSDYIFMTDEDVMYNMTKFPVYNSIKEFRRDVWEAAKQNTMFVCFDVIFARTEIWKNNLFLTEIDGHKIIYGEDLEWLLSMAILKKFIFKLLKVPLARYRAHVNNFTTKNLQDIPNNNKVIRDYIIREVNKAKTNK